MKIGQSQPKLAQLLQYNHRLILIKAAFDTCGYCIKLQFPICIDRKFTNFRFIDFSALTFT